MSKKGLIERLAAQEHNQWAHWTNYMLDHLTAENIERWQKQIATSYLDLSDKERESDRVWAREALEIVQSEARLSYHAIDDEVEG